ncbi:hypothetical protein V6N12_050593 [Hibiscus sabdariffa]|uniref:Uncharacterized protein n=1 Tax=Hibiscus sabdariffa TaxID=183260 RepID=A0ABR2GCU9_9ROSI
MGRHRAQAEAERESPGAVREVVDIAAEVTEATVASVPTERGMQPRTDAATSRIKVSVASSMAPCTSVRRRTVTGPRVTCTPRQRVAHRPRKGLSKARSQSREQASWPWQQSTLGAARCATMRAQPRACQDGWANVQP